MTGLLKKLILGANVDNKIVKIPYLVLAVSLLLSLGVTLFFYKSAVTANNARFNNSITRVQSVVENKINLYIALMKGARAFVESTENLDHEKFAYYVKGLELEKNYAGVQGIGFTKTVFPEEREALASQMKAEGFADFKIFPEGKRDAYQAIIYLEPFSEQNKKALGYDAYTEENRRQALDYARDLAAASLTAKVVLIQDQDENDRAAFMIYLPIYKDGKIPATIQERRQNLVGYIFSQFDAADFLNVIHSETSSDIAMRIYDTEIKQENLLAQSAFVESRSFDNRNTESFYSKNSIELAARKWVIEYVPLSVSAEQSNLKWSPVIFGVGVVFSFILFGLTYAEASTRNRMQNLAVELFDLEQQKHDLLEKEQRARLNAEQANATKDEFIAVVSHELRTPLNAIAGWTKILDNENLPEDKKALALLKIEKNLRKQTRLVEELLDFSQIIAGKAELEAKPLDFSGVFENAFSEMEPLAHGREIVIVKNNRLNGQQIVGDREKIKIVICNLLSNAIKFTPSGGKIEAEAKESAGNIELEIRDTGSGIRGDFLPFIFDRFRQDDASSTRFFDGLGLGLTISEHIVKLHKGSIEAHSEGPGKGSVFIVKIPVNKA